MTSKNRSSCWLHAAHARILSVFYVKSDKDSLIKERIADSIINNDTRDYWTEIERIRANEVGNSRIVGGQAESNNIALLFSDKYRELHTSVPYESDEMLRIQNDIEDLILKNPMYKECRFDFMMSNALSRVLNRIQMMAARGLIVII